MNAVVLLSKTFFPQHPKAGQKTYFAEKITLATSIFCDIPHIVSDDGIIIDEEKLHTCRSNYEYWKKKIDKLKAESGVLSVRQWSVNPYRSPQETIVDIPAENVGIQRLELSREKIHLFDKNKFTYHYTAEVDGKDISINTLANNDGLHIKDFESWFAPIFEKQETDVLYLAIIHFTSFRY